jgi:hypothetical protein
MEGEWEALIEAVKTELDRSPIAVYLPARIPSASDTDAEMLGLVWKTVADRGIPIMPA